VQRFESFQRQCILIIPVHLDAANRRCASVQSGEISRQRLESIRAQDSGTKGFPRFEQDALVEPGKLSQRGCPNRESAAGQRIADEA